MPEILALRKLPNHNNSWDFAIFIAIKKPRPVLPNKIPSLTLTLRWNGPIKEAKAGHFGGIFQDCKKQCVKISSELIMKDF